MKTNLHAVAEFSPAWNLYPAYVRFQVPEGASREETLEAAKTAIVEWATTANEDMDLNFSGEEEIFYFVPALGDNDDPDYERIMMVSFGKSSEV